MENPLPTPTGKEVDSDEVSSKPASKLGTSDAGSSATESDSDDKPIATWTYCRKCGKVVTPLIFISDNTWKFSFGKFLEVFFYNHDAIMNAPSYGCSCNVQQDTVLYFGCGKLAARFTYEPINTYGVFVRQRLPFVVEWHRQEAMRNLHAFSSSSTELFEKFREHLSTVMRQVRALYNHCSIGYLQDHMATVLSELSRLSSHIEHAALSLHEAIAASIALEQRSAPNQDPALFRFHRVLKRSLFLWVTSWNETMRSAGHAIHVLRKANSMTPTHQQLPSVNDMDEDVVEAMRRLRDHKPLYSLDLTNNALPTTSAAIADGDEDELADPLDFSDNVDADVLASRRRLTSGGRVTSPSAIDTLPHISSQRKGRDKPPSPTKSLGTRRGSHNGGDDADFKPTPGGAVKSALTRLFNRGGRDQDPYALDIRPYFPEGRFRLAPGVHGEVIPVRDDQLSTVIAYAMVHPDYDKQFKQFSRSQLSDTGAPEDELLDPMSPTDPTNPKQATTANDVERRMLNRRKSHIKVTFRDYDEKGQVKCKFVCTSYWATQFHALREVFLLSLHATKNTEREEVNDGASHFDPEQGYVDSLSSAESWAASGGKSGATFARTSDDRFVIKNISRTELQMFLECSSAYFEYISRAFFRGL